MAPIPPNLSVVLSEAHLDPHLKDRNLLIEEGIKDYAYTIVKICRH